MKLKIMEYNILHGFHTVKLPFRHESVREQYAVQIVKEQKPDILIITEACFADEFKGHFIDYKKIFGFSYHYHAKKHYEHGISILSNIPLNNPQNFSYDRVHFARVQLTIENKTIMLDAVHPHPALLEQEKTRFIQGVLRDFKKPYLLIGDFNACSSKDKYDPAAMIKSFSRFNKHSEFIVKELLTFNSISAVESHGLIDTYKKIHPHESAVNFTVPTDLLSTDKGSGMRCDSIFCSDDFEINDAGIIKNNITEKASDHYPIYAIVEI